MEKRYRWSAFTHVFEKEPVYALYSSLKLRPIYVDPEILQLVQRFGQGATLSEISANIPLAQQEKLQNILPALDDAKILVAAESTDEEIIQFFRDHHLGHPYVSIAYFILTDACNLGCKYCFIENRMSEGHHPREMSEGIVKKGLDFFGRLMKLNPEFFEEEKTIVLYGGEPLLNGGALRSLLEEVLIRKNDGRFPQKTQINMVTNATLVTPEVAKLLAEHKVGVAVSLDGDAAATNSARQYKNGAPVFDNAVRGLNILRDEGVSVGISCTLTQRSVDDFDSTLNAILERFKTETLGFNILLPGKGYGVSADYDEKAARAIIKGFEVFREKNVFEDRMMRKVNAFTKGELYPFDCGAAGGGQIVIAPDGHVGICHGYLGSRKNFMTTVEDFEFDPRTDSVFIEWSRRSPLGMDACRACPALGICGGGCPLNADQEAGSIWELDQRFCVHCKSALEWLIWDLYQKMSVSADSQGEMV